MNIHPLLLKAQNLINQPTINNPNRGQPEKTDREFFSTSDFILFHLHH